MKKKILSIIAFFVVIFIFTSGLFETVTNVIVWLVTLNFNSPDISIFGQLVVKYGTWIITFSLVGIIFKMLGFFNSDAMKIVYFIISSIISFLFSWLFFVLEQYMLIISIILGSLLGLIIVSYLSILVLYYLKEKKNGE